MSLIIFQEFHLDLDAMVRQSPQNMSDQGERLLDELAGNGYAVLRPGETCNGLPVSILLGGRFGAQDFKGDFYSVADKLGISYYRSGLYYTAHLSESATSGEIVAPRELPSPK